MLSRLVDLVFEVFGRDVEEPVADPYPPPLRFDSPPTAEVAQRLSDLLESPMAVYFLVDATAGRWPPTVPDQPVGVSGSVLEMASYHELAMLEELFSTVGDWPWGPDHWEWAAPVLPHAHLFEPVARYVAELPTAQWWWQPLRRNQQTWVIDITRDDPYPVPLPFSVDFTEYYDFTRPREAFITSTRISPLPAVWLFYAHEGSMSRPLVVWDMPVVDTARVYEIHRPTDWIQLVERYPLDTSDMRRKDWYQRYGQAWGVPDAPVITPNWPRVAEDYDGVHMSVAGLLTATSRPFPVAGGYTMCTRWETEMTIWFSMAAFGKPTRLQDWTHRLPYGSGSSLLQDARFAEDD